MPRSSSSRARSEHRFGRTPTGRSGAPRRADLPLAIQVAGERDHRRGTAAEIGDCRERYPTRDALASDAGQAAVAVESGKWKTAGFRRACNKRLRVAFCRLADSSRHWHPWAQDLYAQSRQRGHEHPRAIRTVGRAWCRVVWQCWRRPQPLRPCASPRTATPHHSDHPELIRPQCPTSSPHSGWPAPLSPNGRPARVEREALDRNPTSATARG